MASVLGFFVSSGITVLSSSDNLFNNLRKGLEEVSFDSNPHDMVLVSKLFKPSQNLNVDPSYEINLDHLKITTDRGWRWAFNSNNDQSFIKSEDKKKLEASRAKRSSDSSQKKLEKLEKSILTIPSPKENKRSFTHGNYVLVCSSTKQFISSLEKEVVFKDRNKASFRPKNDTNSFSSVAYEEDIHSKNIIATCPGDSPSEETYVRYLYYFHELYRYFIDQNKDQKLSEEELSEIHENEFNPKLILKYTVDHTSDISAYRPILEQDYYFSFDIEFKNKLAGKDISEKFKKLAVSMRDSPFFYKLDDTTRQSVNAFLNTSAFKELKTKYYFSSLMENLDLFNSWLPMVPGMTFREASILIFKLILWEFIENHKNSLKIGDFAKSFEYSDDKKTKIKGIINKWPQEPQGLKSWDPFKDPEKEQKEQKEQKSEDFIFSTFRPLSALSEFKKNKDYQEYKGKESSGGEESEKDWCNGNGNGNCSNLVFSNSDRFFSAWKKLLIAWIDDNYYSPTTPTTPTTGKKVIPAFEKNSKAQAQAQEAKLFEKKDGKRIYRPYPDTFENVYKTVASHIVNSLKDYLVFVQIQNLREVRKFINDNNVFTLSFLLYNFKYSPDDITLAKHKNSSRNLRLTSSNYESSTPSYENSDDYSVSLNYHKSLVVSNVGSTSAKVNDKTKTNHSFKVITQEVRDDSSLNRIKVISGNPLYEVKRDYQEILKRINFWKASDSPDKFPSSYEFKDIFKVLSRAKYTNPEYASLFKTIYRYYASPFPDTWTDKIYFHRNQLEKTIQYIGHLESNVDSFRTQGSKLILNFLDYEQINFLRTFSYGSKAFTLPTAGYIDQFSSAFGLVSPFYAKQNNIKPISNEKYEFFKKLVYSDEITQEEWEREYYAFLLDPSNHDHIININGNKIIVVGTALTPDMLLPSHSWLNLVPNKEKEALVFVDQYGFKNIQYNSLSTWNEFYLSLAYPQIVKDLGIEDDYRMKLTKYMNDFLFEDASDPLASDNSEFELRLISDPSYGLGGLVFLRSNYVDKFIGTVSIFSYILLLFLGAIIFFTVWTLIKKYISSSLNTFGVFVANGVTRENIIFNSFIFILIPAITGTVLGYSLSLLLQPLVFGMFSDIWYLTPIFSGFNLPSMLYYVFLTVAILGPLSFLLSFKMMKPGVSQLMKFSVIFKQNKLVKWIYSCFDQTSALWRFRISVILNTISRGFILSAATISLFVFSNFLMNNLGQFENVSNLEIGSKNYGFDMSFETPTEQAGQYYLTSYKNLGKTFLDNVEHEKKVLVRDKDKSSWKTETIKFDKENPEVIATGVYSPFHADDFANYFANCTSEIAGNIQKQMNAFNPEYPSRLFLANPYNLFLLKSELKKEEKEERNCGEQKLKKLKKEFIKLPKPSHESLKLFYSSKNSSKSTFEPDLSDDNVQELLNIGDYVPVKNEKWKNDNQQQQQQNGEKQEITFGDEALFKPLIDKYKNAEALLKKNEVKNESATNLISWDFVASEAQEAQEALKGDFRKLNNNNNNNNNNWYPTLSRLFKDNSNYWLFSYSDLRDTLSDPVFFKNRVIVSFLFNHNWTFNLFGKTVMVNPWSEFNDFFDKYSPELVSSMESNYVNFVNAIINSRYGNFFVTRFMTKHSNPPLSDSYAPGKEHNGKKTWRVKPDQMKKPNNGNNGNNVEDGHYFFDSSKIIYLYDKFKAAGYSTSSNDSLNDSTQKLPDRFVIFRPDFLYLFFALMNDDEFLKPEIAPIKITFNSNVYTVDYGQNGQSDSWVISGDPKADAKLKKGLTASHDEHVNDEDYEKDVNGDQTYTYLKGSISLSSLKDIKVFGLKQDPRGSYVKLTKNGKTINKRLYEEKEKDEYPVIINQYTAKKLGVSEGSVFELEVSNTYDRYTKKLKGDFSNKKVKLKVIDIFDSYFQTAFYMSQKNANEIIGLNPDYGYNGMFTKKFSSSDGLPMQLSKAISGYSPTGFFVRRNVSKSDSGFKVFLETTGNEDITNQILKNSSLIQPKNYQWFGLRNGLSLTEINSNVEIDNLADKIDKVFGGHFALTPAIVDIYNASVSNDFIFNTASDLVLSVINLFISVFTPLLICSLLIITALIIEDLKNILTILNLLGFTYLENSITILLYLGLVLGFSTLISIPLSSSLLSLYVDGLFSNIQVYLPLYLRFDYLLCSLGILLSMFGFSYLKAMRKIKGLYLPLAMKSLNE